jgi:hypothetical protein
VLVVFSLSSCEKSLVNGNSRKGPGVIIFILGGPDFKQSREICRKLVPALGVGENREGHRDLQTEVLRPPAYQKGGIVC